LTPQEVIDFFVQMPDFELGFEVDFVIVLRAQTIAQFGAILTHHDDRGLNGRQGGENQIQQNEWIGIKRAVQQENTVQDNPAEQHRAEEDDKSPAAAKRGYLIGQPFAESELPLELFADVAGENLMLVQAFYNFVVERGQFADLLLQNFLHVLFPEFAQIVQADETGPVPIGHSLFDKFEKRRPDQFGQHAVVRRFRF